MILPLTYKSPADFIDYRESRINSWWLDSDVRASADSSVEDVHHPAAATLPQDKLKPARKSHDLDLSILLQLPPAVEDEPIAAALVFRCRLGMRIFGALQMDFASVV